MLNANVSPNTSRVAEVAGRKEVIWTEPSELGNPMLDRVATSFYHPLLTQRKSGLQELFPAVLLRRNQLKSELQHQTQGILILPLFDDFAGHPLSYGASRYYHLLAGRRDSHKLTCVCAPPGPPCKTYVPFEDCLVHRELKVGVGAQDGCEELFVGLEAFKIRIGLPWGTG